MYLVWKSCRQSNQVSAPDSPAPKLCGATLLGLGHEQRKPHIVRLHCAYLQQRLWTSHIRIDLLTTTNTRIVIAAIGDKCAHIGDPVKL